MAPASVPGSEPIRIAVVGHTNAGKTSLLRTLSRRIDFGEVSDRPGTTRHVESIDLRADGRAAVRFFDTPGIEDAVALQEHLHLPSMAPADALPAERVRRFLAGPEAHGVFEQEAKVLRTLLGADAAFLVIDVRAPVLPKYRAEIALLHACARPVLPVLNFVRDGAGREADWRALLADAGLHAVVRFDATAPFTGAERDLYQDLGTLLPTHRVTLQRVVQALGTEAEARQGAALREIASLLVRCTALRRSVPDASAAAMRSAADALQAEVRQAARHCIDTLLALHGFRADDADEAPLPHLEGRWEMDLFSPEALKAAGLRLGAGTAAGAVVGVVTDIALAGLSLGAGAALGGAIGGAVSQGWGPLGRKVWNRARGVRELTVDDAALALLVRWQRVLLQALERRGHADPQRLQTSSLPYDTAAGSAMAALRAAHPARSHPDWADLRSADPARQALVKAVAHALRAGQSG
ncbi:GTPase/DUF3482 domain-containing protein [Xylophilus ampelinus]|nr:GTPase/DUF3482 domain-containing protein [Xylophilus ampelinus]MCS4508663.1 GTPase/DUF3482 domain-containing protein [Xylophilus ampelinus]